MFTHTKKSAQSAHFRRRALERLGHLFNKAQRREIISLIHTQKAQFIKRTSCRVSVWRVTYAGIDFQVVYDNRRHNLVTVLI